MTSPPKQTEQVRNNPVTVINPKPAPHDSFVGPEFVSVQAAIKRSDRICKCTACGVEKDCTFHKLYAHPVLNVLLCDTCEKFYHAGDFTKDSEGYDEQCRWCGQGGNLLMCDSPNCTYSFCNFCIKRNFSPQIFADILAKETWKCFCCDKSQLLIHVDECRRFVNFSSTKSPQQKENSFLETVNVSIPESLTKTNKQIDSILDPLERSYNGLGHRLSKTVENDGSTNSKLSYNRVTPLTIFRKHDQYVVQRNSVSCDERDPISHDPSTQSDPELPRKMSKMKLRERKVSKTPKEKPPFNESCLGEKPAKQSIVKRDSDIQHSIHGSTNGNVDAGINPVNNLNEKINAVTEFVLSNNHDTAATTKPLPVRRNVGRRTKANRVGSGYEKENHNSQMKKSDTYGLESDEVTDHKSQYSNPRLEKAGELFEQYIKVIKDLILEDCSLRVSSSTPIPQSPSQYSRFRAADAVLRHVKLASKQLSVMQLNLRETKTKLATYRDVAQSTKGDEHGLNWGHKVKNLMEEFIQMSNSKADSSSSDTDEISIADDVKLHIEPQVRIKKLDEEEFKRLIALCGDPQSHSDMSSLMLDSDSSKQHHGLESEDAQSSTDGPATDVNVDDISSMSSDLDLSSDDSESDETEGSTNNATVKKTDDNNGPKLSKKPTNKKMLKKAAKKEVSDSSDYNSSMDDLPAPKISTNLDFDEGDNDVHEGPAHESDNEIAKNELLQLLEEDNADELDSDVEDLLSKENENKQGSKSNESTSRNTTSSGKSSTRHPLLSRHWDKSLPSTNRPTSKRRKSQNDENPSKKKRKHSANFDDKSESDLSTDSEADIWVRKPGAGMKRSKQVIRDSDSDKLPDARSEDGAFDNLSSYDSDYDFEFSLKRRRTGKVLPSSNTKNDETPTKQGRKNIRKVLDDNETSQLTQEAEMEEAERRRRVEAEREGNEADVIVIDDENSQDDLQSNTDVKKHNITLILSSNPIVEVHPEIAQHMKPHQREGVRFIWENLIERVSFANTKEGNGCILSHCMGLGKTLQAIAFLHAVLLSDHLPKIRTALVICPFITVNNWVAELKQWIPKEGRFDKRLYYCSLDSAKTDEDRKTRLQTWKTGGGILIIGYGLFRSLLKRKQNDSSSWEMGLLELDILVCDEGHILKNAATALAQLANQVKTKRRLILTGTPLQNNMIEYHCMVSLVKPRLLGGIKEFKNRFVNPIENGQHVDSTDRDVRLMKKRAHVLHELLAGCVQRKDYTYLKEHLPPKYEYTLKVRLSQLQIRLYEKYLSLKPTANLKSRKASLFRDFNKFLLIVCHPRCLIMQNETRKKPSECDDDNEEDEAGSSSDESVIILSDDDNGEAPAMPVVPKPTSLEDIHALSSRKLRLFIKSKSDKQPEAISRRKLVSMAANYLDENFCKTKEFEDSMKSKPVTELKAMIKEHGGSLVGCREKSDLVNLLKSLLLKEATSEEKWFEKLIPSQEKLYFANEHGGKIVLMLEILRAAAKLGDKVVLFSQSLITLNLIELTLRAESNNSDSKSTDPFSKWVKNKDYFRIDGSTPRNTRTSVISRFNNHNNHRGRLLLVSTRAGSMGVNLIGANRAIVFDSSWNPTHDIQSIFRIYRFGQTKICYIYRLVAQGAMEEKVYERQVVKRSLSYRVVDEQQIPRHFTAADVSDLYTFKPDTTKRKVPDSAPPSDALLASIINSTNLIVSFHEPDTLLDHQVSEELSEADRKAAWEEYNVDNGKTKKVSQSFTGVFNNMPQHVFMSLCKHAENNLRMIDHELLTMSEKSLNEKITEMRIENRAITTEQANLKVIEQKLNNHIKRRRLNNLKKLVSWHSDTARKTYQSRFQAPLSNGGSGSAASSSSAGGSSGSPVFRLPVGVDPSKSRPQNPNPSRYMNANYRPRFNPRSQPFVQVRVPHRPRHQQPPTMQNSSFRFNNYRHPRPPHPPKK